MTEPTESTAEAGGTPSRDGLPENPREDPAATVDALEDKVSRESPDQPDQDRTKPDLDGAGSDAGH